MIRRSYAGIGGEFYDPTEDDIPTDEDKLRTGLDVNTDNEDDTENPLSLEDVEGYAAMED